MRQKNQIRLSMEQFTIPVSTGELAQLVGRTSALQAETVVGVIPLNEYGLWSGKSRTNFNTGRIVCHWTNLWYPVLSGHLAQWYS